MSTLNHDRVALLAAFIYLMKNTGTCSMTMDDAVQVATFTLNEAQEVAARLTEDGEIVPTPAGRIQ